MPEANLQNIRSFMKPEDQTNAEFSEFYSHLAICVPITTGSNSSHTSSAVTLSEGSHVMMETSVPYQLPHIVKLRALDLKQRPWVKLIPSKCIDKMYYLNAILFWIKQSKQKALQIGSTCLLHEVSVKMSRSLSFLLLLKKNKIK